MSQAESLLNSLSVKTKGISVSPINDVLIIDAEGRIINVPSTEIIFGVETDKDVERKHFQCPKIVGDNIDLSTLSLRVHYQNAKGELDKYIVTDLNVDGDYITFSWLLGASLLRYKGTVNFAICAVRVDDNGVEINEWNTTIASGTVLAGLEVDDLTEDEEITVRDVLQQSLDLIQTKTDEASQNVKIAGVEQISAIEAKGEETLAKIPDQVVGLKGDTGPQGPQGPKGEAGVTGEDGVGIQSVIQTTKSEEASGANIVTVTLTDGTSTSFEIQNGSKGDKGEPGLQGPKGDTGSQGPKGDTGATGEQGPKGDKGDTGEQGPKGDKGETGEKGDTGLQGPKGDKGDKGDTGADGLSIASIIIEEV